MNADSVPPPRRVLLGLTGSIAAAMAPATVCGLQALWQAEVQVVMTAAATRFASPHALAVLTRHPVECDGGPPGDQVSHLALTRWAELVLIAPATANTLGLIAHGLGSNAVALSALAASCPVVVVPSMNGCMWTQPAVQRNVALLEADGRGVMPPTLGRAVSDGAATLGAMGTTVAVLSWTQDWLARSWPTLSSDPVRD